MGPMKLFGQLRRGKVSGRIIWIGDPQPMPGDEEVLLIPLSGPDTGALQPESALAILSQEEHACTGSGCSHCASVRVLAAALCNEQAAA